MQEQPITEAVVEQPVSGATSLGVGALNYPSPAWVRKVIRACTWITAIWAILSITVDLKDFGVSEHLETLIVKYAASFTGLVSVIARFIGVKPVNLAEGNN